MSFFSLQEEHTDSQNTSDFGALISPRVTSPPTSTININTKYIIITMLVTTYTYHINYLILDYQIDLKHIIMPIYVSITTTTSIFHHRRYVVPVCLVGLYDVTAC